MFVEGKRVNKYIFAKKCIKEAYTKTELDFIKSYVKDLRKFLIGEIKYSDLTVWEIKYNIRTALSQTLHTEAYYDEDQNMIVVELSTRFGFYEKDLIDEIRAIYVHEDTHRQQANQSSLYNKDYKYPEAHDPFDLKSSENRNYFNQFIEADAYGRQCGEKLRAIYETEEAEEILELISKNKIDVEYDENFLWELKTYRSKALKQETKKRFFRALYDYLKGEDTLKEEKSWVY